MFSELTVQVQAHFKSLIPAESTPESYFTYGNISKLCHKFTWQSEKGKAKQQAWERESFSSRIVRISVVCAHRGQPGLMSTTAKGMPAPPQKKKNSHRCRGYHTEQNIRLQLPALRNPPHNVAEKTQTHAAPLTLTKPFYILSSFLLSLPSFLFLIFRVQQRNRLRTENIFRFNTMS